MKARVSRQPALDLGVLMRGVVVPDQVELPIQGDGLVDQEEKLEPFLMAMPLLAQAEDFAVGRLQRGKQSGRAVAFVVVRHGGPASALPWRAGTNILTHRGLFQLGFGVYLIEMACQIAMTALFYDLLKPAGRSVSLLAAFLGFAGCVIKTLSRVFFIAPLFVLGGAHYLSVFSAEQLQALALLLLKVNDNGAAIALVFFGFYALLTGYPIIRSMFLPRILGVLSVFGGLGWLSFLYPPLGYRLFPHIAVLGLLGAASLIFWLLVFGVNEQRWKEQARAAGERQ